MEALHAYIPIDRRHALSRGIAVSEWTQGAGLFADISGFTPLTEGLTRALGARRGGEALTSQINQVYDALIREVEAYGGSVISFSGDAVTCWFDHHWSVVGGQWLQGDADPATAATQRAVACALALQQAMAAFAAIVLPDGRTTALTLKVAVTGGPARRFLVGDPAVQVLDVLAGTTIARLATAERLARAGDVLLDETSAAALPTSLTVVIWRSDHETGERFAVVSGQPDPALRALWPPLPTDGLADEQVRLWVLPAIYERQRAGLGAFVTELRPAVAVLALFGGIDYDTDLEASIKLDAFIRAMQAILARHDGTLLQLTIGDKGSYLYAGFGVPIAHEDDVRRAARVALAWRALPTTLAFLPPLQIGISRGIVRAGAYGSSSRQTYGALGSEVNVAARLMSRAVPGEILLSSHVHDVLTAAFGVTLLAPVQLKCVAAPVPLFRLDDERAQAIRLLEPTYTLPMIGRASELNEIAGRLTQALAGQGQVIGITAEAGMGKSRLLAETIRLAMQQGLVGYGGACEASGTATSYLVWQPIWRGLFGFDPTTSPSDQIQMVGRAMEAWAPERVQALPLLGPLLGVAIPDNTFTTALGPQYRKSALEALLVDCFRAIVHQAANNGGGVLLVLEDLHWIDALSHDLLERIAQQIVDLPVLLVVAYRSPELTRLQAPRIEALPYFTSIILTALPQGSTTAIIQAKLAQRSPTRAAIAPPLLIERVTARAQGNPFYVEELVNYLVDQGIDPHDTAAIAKLELPSSLHLLVLTRIDQLTVQQQAQLRVASVIGRVFQLAWLHGAYPMLGDLATLQANLDELARLELTPQDMSSETELSYLFKHIVTQEVAYESLPLQTRTALHEQLAVYLEQLAGDDTERYVDLLAYHYDHSANQPKRRHYLRRAGRAAKDRYASDAAIDYLNRALALAPNDDLVGRYVLVNDRYDVHSLITSVACVQDIEALVQLAEALDDDWCRIETLIRRTRYALDTHDYRGVTTVQQALPLAQAVGAFRFAGLITAYWGYSLHAQGQIDAAEVQAEASLQLVHAAHTTPSVARGAIRAQIEALQGEAVERRITRLEAYVPKLLGHIQAARGDYAAAYTSELHSLRLHDELGEQSSQPDIFNSIGEVLRMQGVYADAQHAYDQCIQIARITSGANSNLEGYALSNIALVAHHQQNNMLARTTGEKAIAIARIVGNRYLQASASTAQGHALLEFGQPAAARASYQAALEIWRGLNHLLLATENLAGLARVALAEDDRALALAHVEEILAYLADGGTLDGTDEPLRISLTCYQVLTRQKTRARQRSWRRRTRRS